MIRRTLYLTSVAILALAVLVVPLPLLVIEPGTAASVTGRGGDPAYIRVDAPDAELNGSFLLTSIQISSQPAGEVVQALLDRHEEVTLRGTVVPPGIDPEQFLELQREQYRESVRVAGAVGARAAGREVTITGDGARVEAVMPEGPSEGSLQPGDVIVTADGTTIDLAIELQNLLEGRDPGDVVELEVRRGDDIIDRRLTLAPIRTLRAGLGVLVSTVDRRIDLPVEVEPGDEVNIAGPSAGLMFALAVYDLLAEDDLAAGRTIAGTGTIDLQGEVGTIGGIEAKVATAEAAGAEVFLAPADQAGAARNATAGGIEVVPVATLEDAVAALSSG